MALIVSSNICVRVTVKLTYILVGLAPTVPDSPSNPFIDSNNPTQTPPPHSTTSSPGETFDFPDDSESSVTSSPTPAVRDPDSRPIAQDTTSLPQPPRHPSQTTSRPVVGEQPNFTANTRAAAPAKKKSAQDVWTFFKDMDHGRMCVFCE